MPCQACFLHHFHSRSSILLPQPLRRGRLRFVAAHLPLLSRTISTTQGKKKPFCDNLAFFYLASYRPPKSASEKPGNDKANGHISWQTYPPRCWKCLSTSRRAHGALVSAVSFVFLLVFDVHRAGVKGHQMACISSPSSSKLAPCDFSVFVV